MRRSADPRRCCVCDYKEKPGEDFNVHESACIEAEWARDGLRGELPAAEGVIDGPGPAGAGGKDG